MAQEIAQNNKDKDILRRKADASLNAIFKALGSIQGKPGAERYFSADHGDGNLTTLNLGTLIPDQDHKGLFLKYEPNTSGLGTAFRSNGDGTYTITLYIAEPSNLDKREEFLDNWNKTLINNVYNWFFYKKSYYINEFIKYLRTKYFFGRGGGDNLRPLKTGDEKEDKKELKKFYNDPINLDKFIARTGEVVLDRIRSSNNPNYSRKELNLDSPDKFIDTVYNKFFEKDVKTSLSVSNRFKVFRDLYDLYLKAKDELMKKKTTTTSKLSANELSEMIRKEVVALLESEKGTPEWKTIDKHEKTDTTVQPPKEVDGGDVEQVSLKDLMGLGGEEVLKKPEDHVPDADKGDEKTQLEPSAKKPGLNENAFLMHDVLDTDDWRF